MNTDSKNHFIRVYPCPSVVENSAVHTSSHDAFDNLPMDIRQPEIPSIVPIRQFLMIESKLPEHRRVQVMDVHLVLHCTRAELIRRAVSCPAFDSPARQPHAERASIVISARR